MTWSNKVTLDHCKKANAIMERAKLEALLVEYSPNIQLLSFTDNYATIRLPLGPGQEGVWTLTFHRGYVNEARLRSTLDALFRQP